MALSAGVVALCSTAAQPLKVIVGDKAPWWFRKISAAPRACVDDEDFHRTVVDTTRRLLVRLGDRTCVLYSGPMSSVVWILGAGFSKSLGAPLLSEMLRLEALQSVVGTYDDFRARRYDFTSVIKTYLYGAYDLPNNPHARKRLWRHAEEFAEKLDAACGSESLANILRDLCSDSATEHKGNSQWANKLRVDTLQLMAAECCAFTEDADLESERWGPYKHWAQGLTGDDTVVTSNYDRVPDLLAEHRLGDKNAHLVVPTPAEVEGLGTTVRVLKLHGSVDWFGRPIQRVEETDVSRWSFRHRVAMGCSADDIGIATPGRSKHVLVQDQAGLAPLWLQAELALKNASTVAIVGYSLPSSDAFSRGWLVKQLRANREKERAERGAPVGRPRRLKVHTVLGSNVASAESTRLKALLESISGIEVKQHAMWAEDFLDVADRKALLS